MISAPTNLIPAPPLNVSPSQTPSSPPRKEFSDSIDDLSVEAKKVPFPSHLTKISYWTSSALEQPKNQKGDLSPSNSSLDLPKYLSAATVDASKNLSQILSQTWRDAHAALVYNFDMELDDQQRLQNVLHTWSDRSKPTKARLILVAGQRTGAEDTFEDLIHHVRFFFGQDTLFTAHDKDRAQINTIDILRGAPLKIITQDDSAQASHCADRLAGLLRGTPFLFHNNTSESLFAHLSPTTQINCRAHICTCDAILTPKALIDGINYRWNIEAYVQAQTACRQIKIPFISIHGSTLGFSRQTLSEMPLWTDILDRMTPDPSSKRQQIRFSMQQILQWTGRIYGSIRNLDGATVSTDIASITHDKLQVIFGDNISSSCQSWTSKPTRPETYKEEDCELASAQKRARAIAENIRCPLNNTIGDFAASVLDQFIIPEDVLFLPMKVLHPTSSSAGSITMSDAASHLFIAAHAKEDHLLSLHGLISQIKTSASTSLSEEYGRPVDAKLCSEWQAFELIMKKLLTTIIQETKDMPEEKFDSREHLFRALEHLKSGPMSTIIKQLRNIS